MKALLHHDEPDKLMQASRRSKSGRVAQRLLAIRDIMLGRSRGWVCAQYKLTETQRAALQARLSVPPEIGKDGVRRWGAADVQRLIRREYGVEYRSITSVCNLLHQLGQSWISGRPQQPQQTVDALVAFKKTPSHTPGHRRHPSRRNH